MTRLFGKSAFITGAAQGIGFEFAKAYVAEGAKVVLADIDEKKVRKAALELGDTAFAVVLDVRDQESINLCLLYTSPSPRDAHESRMPSSA